ncbi:DUF3060 domain-containing protein [Microbacterium sp.]|uniref:DUF3060 domain-containing protein n=1 Tax=Microbacterium sp. TaxID=51671 RepID=UPI0039E3A799
MHRHRRRGPSASLSQTPATDAGSTPTTDVTDEATGDAADDGSSVIVSDEVRDRLRRDRWTDSVTSNFTCTSDDYVIDHVHDAMVVDVTGDCTDVTIEAHAGVTLLPAVKNLTITGDGGIVIVASAETITITGSAWAVGWESGTPAIHDQGTLNATTPISR